MTGSNQKSNEPAALVEEKGPWPFVTQRLSRSADGSQQVWSSRHHRKGLLIRAAAQAEGLAPQLLRCLWMPRQLNWWIGIIFALGSLLFALASVLSLAPQQAQASSLDTTEINAIFFAGSMPFTIAAYLQLFQAANAADASNREAQPLAKRPVLFGWRPQDVGWLSCALQFVGTILFNVNTLDAMLPSLNWFEQDLVVWAPNVIGSILFLASGYLAFIETCHAYWAWKPAKLSWWVVFVNLLGCVGFMVSALFAFVLPGPANVEAITLATGFTLQGAVCFFLGSVLMLPEGVGVDQ